MSVPRIVAKNVPTIATKIEFRRASASPGRLSGAAHASSENSAHTKLNLPTGLLNENTIMTRIGTIR